jgi:hypothetical protein
MQYFILFCCQRSFQKGWWGAKLFFARFWPFKCEKSIAIAICENWRFKCFVLHLCHIENGLVFFPLMLPSLPKREILWNIA